MEKGKVVFIVRVEAGLREAFIAGAPPNMQVITPDPNSTDEEFIEQVRDADFLVVPEAGIPRDVSRTR